MSRTTSQQALAVLEGLENYVAAAQFAKHSPEAQTFYCVHFDRLVLAADHDA